MKWKGKMSVDFEAICVSPIKILIEKISAKNKISLKELFPWSFAIALGMMLFFAPHPEWHGDLDAFRNYSDTLWHPYWARWIFSSLNIFSEQTTYILLSLTSILFLFFANRVLAGRHWIVFTSFAFAWTLYYGQIDSLVVGGIAFAWWALNHDKPILIGAGLILASIKPQLSLPLILIIWWWSPGRLKSLIIPLIVFILSLLQWGFWVPEWLLKIMETGNIINLSRNLSLWTLLGPIVLLIWPALFWLPLPRNRKLLAIAAGTAMTFPYFPLPSSILFLAMPVPVWLYVLSQLPLLASVTGYEIYYFMKIIPIVLVIWVSWPVIKRYIRQP